MSSANESESTRLFVVGCPRSGTTLLQSLLAAHPQLTSFPESHFFNHLDPHTRWRRLLRMPHRRARSEFEAFMEDVGVSGFELGPTVLTRRQFIDRFIGELDRLAAQRGASVWLEKTPSHLKHIERITDTVQGARFIHIVRCGVDVVASLYAVTHDYPDVWGGARDIDTCIDRWLGSIALTERWSFEPNHTVVSYETLVGRPRPILEQLCQFAGLDYRPQMLSDFQQAADEVVRQEEHWKESNTGALRNANRTKFFERFTEEQRDYIVDRLEEAEPAWPVR